MVFLCAGTYFNCIMFMVASSVVSTIMILNYHHRQADTHKMPPWVRYNYLPFFYYTCLLLGQSFIPSMDSLGLKNVPARGKTYSENYFDGKQTERAGCEGELIKILTC